MPKENLLAETPLQTGGGGMSHPIDHAWFVSARADPLLDDGSRLTELHEVAAMHERKHKMQ